MASCLCAAFHRDVIDKQTLAAENGSNRNRVIGPLSRSDGSQFQGFHGPNFVCRR